MEDYWRTRGDPALSTTTPLKAGLADAMTMASDGGRRILPGGSDGRLARLLKKGTGQVIPQSPQDAIDDTKQAYTRAEVKDTKDRMAASKAGVSLDKLIKQRSQAQKQRGAILEAVAADIKSLDDMKSSNGERLKDALMHIMPGSDLETKRANAIANNAAFSWQIRTFLSTDS